MWYPLRSEYTKKIQNPNIWPTLNKKVIRKELGGVCKLQGLPLKNGVDIGL